MIQCLHVEILQAPQLVYSNFTLLSVLKDFFCKIILHEL